MLLSENFNFKGYAPHHPLSFASRNRVQKAASLVLATYTKQVLNRKEIRSASVSLKELDSSKFTVAATLVKKYIDDLSVMDELELNSYNFVQLKKDMLNIYEGVLAGALKNKNGALAKQAVEEYGPGKINIFDDND